MNKSDVVLGLESAEYYFHRMTVVCPKEYKHYYETKEQAIKEAIALLKEQEAVKPHYNARTNWYECGDCHYSMTSGMHCRNELIPAYKVGFCAKCGKGVKWDE